MGFWTGALACTEDGALVSELRYKIIDDRTQLLEPDCNLQGEKKLASVILS